jgi:hypothetical protein
MRRSFAVVTVLCLALAFAGCNKKSADGGMSGEPVEGSSSTANEKAAENPPDEMQQREKKDEAAAPAESSEKPAEKPASP